MDQPAGRGQKSSSLLLLALMLLAAGNGAAGGASGQVANTIQLGGTDTFGGVSTAGGSWALEYGSDVISLCVLPDLSVIDSWGITYHSDATIRGADLNDLLRYSE